MKGIHVSDRWTDMKNTTRSSQARSTQAKRTIRCLQSKNSDCLWFITLSRALGL